MHFLHIPFWGNEIIQKEYLLQILIQEYKLKYPQLNCEGFYFEIIIRHLMYLFEWKYVLEYGEKLSNAKWQAKIISYIDFEADFKNINLIKRMFVDEKLSKIIEFVLKKHEKFEFKYTKICHLCQCTYPNIVLNKYDFIDFKVLSKKYILEYDFKRTINI